jgi:hypothetical protein
MSDLNEAKGLIAKGDHGEAIPLLASILLKDKDQVEAWFLLGELIDDPFRKKYCYQQVLRLVPDHAQASARLQNLEKPPAPESQMRGSKAPRTHTKSSWKHLSQNSMDVRSQTPYSPIRNQGDDRDVIAYVMVGIVAFMIFLYAIVNRNDTSNNNTIFYVGFLLLILIAGLIIGSASNKHGD